VQVHPWFQRKLEGAASPAELPIHMCPAPCKLLDVTWCHNGKAEFEFVLTLTHDQLKHDMASRTRRKSSPATKNIPVSAGKDAPSSKSSRTREKPIKIDDNASDGEKENKAKPTRSKPKPPNKSAHDGKIKDKTSYCLCNQPDDGSPMVCCSLCNEWCAILVSDLGVVMYRCTLQVSFPVCQPWFGGGIRAWYVIAYRTTVFPLIFLQRCMFALLALRRPVNAV